MVKEAKADLQEIRAIARQSSLDRSSQIVAALYAVRNSERQTELFEGRIIPTAERIVENVRGGYSAGTGSFIDLIDAQRVLLDARLAAAEARAARETSLTELEALVGVELAPIAPTEPSGDEVAPRGQADE
jgi:outer membrane protein TolC